ncbi:hypothetical protein H072_2749 [Dactylellina haptotyla CBS 200.50]|uniref:Uncharacterized protein n=1 Tax=Dactylellina haptotyla (strain CBS 200.50) TaxID=1284197 RepID=S8AK05_DACHA|nr:hypothetical protein H072_2749 [Dactylellina haptotyla CBS 200.50]
MVLSTELEIPQQPSLTAEQAHALEAAMASGSLRVKKSVNGRAGITSEAIFKPGYQIGASVSQGFLSPKISPGQDQRTGL